MSASAYPSFELLGDNADLRPWVNTINRVTEEAILVIEDDGVYVSAVDPANVGMVETTLSSSKLDRYDVQRGRIGVNIAGLHDALTDISKRDQVRIEGRGPDREIRVHDVQAGAVVGELMMIDPDSVRSPPTLPDLDFKTSVVVPGDQFSRLVRVSRDVSNNIVMGVAPEGTGERGEDMAFRILAEGDVDELIGYPDYEFEGRGSPAEVVGARYSLEYVNDFRLGLDRPASTDVVFSFPGVEFPFFMEFGVGQNPRIDVAYILAPRIESGGDIGNLLTKWPVDSTALRRVDWTVDLDTEQAKLLFPVFGTFVDEYKLLVTELGMEMRAVDPGNFAMSAVEVTPTYFNSYEEVAGFPQGPIGISTDRVETLLKKWRLADDFEFAADHQHRMVSLKHPIFTARLATINPDSIRAEPTLPDLEVTAEATVPVAELSSAADHVLGITDHMGVLVTDETLYVVGVGDDEERFRALNTTDTRGRALALFSGDYIEKVLDTVPDEERSVTVRVGFEMPMAVQSMPEPGLSILYLIAPRVQPEDSSLVQNVRDLFADEPVDVSWLADGPAGARESGVSVDAFTGFERQSIEERVREQRLSTFPIQSTISTTGTPEKDAVGVRVVGPTTAGGEGLEVDFGIRIADAEDMAVPDSTFEDVLDKVENTLRFDAIDTGEMVARVTFEDDRTFSLEFVNIQPEIEYRTATADGVRMSRISKEENNYAYVSEQQETPAQERVVVRATADPDGDDFTVFVGMKRREQSAKSDDVATVVSSGHPTIGNAYAELLDYVQDHTVRELVAEAGGEIDLTDQEVRQQLEEIVEPFVDYRLEGKPGSTSSDFYAAIIARQTILPDAVYRADINVMQPGSEAEGYLVRYSLSLEAGGPGNERVERLLAENVIGTTATREGIAPRVREAFDQLESFGDVYVRREHRPAPPQSASAGPGVREGDIDAWVEFYLPAPKAELVEVMEGHGLVLPVELTDVEGVGSVRAETLMDAGISDMLDLVALTGTTKNTFIGQLLLDIPEAPRQNLTDAAGTIWKEIIWPRRDAPEGFEPPETDIKDDIEPKAEEAEADEDLPPEVQRQTRDDPPYPVEVIRENVRALGLPLEFEEIEGMGPARIEPFTEVGLRDMVDVALVAGFERAPIAVTEAIEQLPRDLQQRVDDLAFKIHGEAILDAGEDGLIPIRREGPPGVFAFKIPADLRSPQKRIRSELRKRNAVNPEHIDTDELNGEILVTVRGASVTDEEVIGEAEVGEEVIEEEPPPELEEEPIETEPEPGPEPRERERREIDAVGGEIRAEPVVRLEGGQRSVQVESPEVDLDVETRNEIKRLIEEEIDIRQVPIGEPLGEVRVAVDGVMEVNLERAKELLGERVEGSQRAAEAIDILKE